MTFQFSEKEISLLTSALQEAEQIVAQLPNIKGAYAKSYELVFAMISKDAYGNAIIRETTDAQGNSALLDSDNNVVDLSTWQVPADKSTWQRADSTVDVGSWVFLRGVPDVNMGSAKIGGETDYSKFIREYTKAQYIARFGSDILSQSELDQKVQEISNGIANNILRDVITPNVVGNFTLPSENRVKTGSETGSGLTY